MTIRLHRADPRSVAAALAVQIDVPAVAVVGLDEGRLVGSGGLAWGDGRCWIWFKMIETKPAYALPILRETRRMLRRAEQLGETTVWTIRDEEPNSRKLLGHLGFEFIGIEAFGGVEAEVWRWVSSST